MPSSTALLALGRKTYEKECLACHGAKGDGEGEAAYLLFPRPRDFTSGQFRLISTWDGVPPDEDLFRTISRGMPGSAMPSGQHLGSGRRRGPTYRDRERAGDACRVRGRDRDRPLADAEQTTVARSRGTLPAQLSGLLRGDLDWIVMRCLEKDRTRRYETANGLAMDLQRHLRNEPVVARPPSSSGCSST